MAVEVPGASPLPAETEARYRGKWIAVREDAVVAAAEKYDDLVADERVLPEDDVYCVAPAL